MFLGLQPHPLGTGPWVLTSDQGSAAEQRQSVGSLVDGVLGVQRSSCRADDKEFPHFFFSFSGELAQSTSDFDDNWGVLGVPVLDSYYLLHGVLWVGVSLPGSGGSEEEDESEIRESVQQSRLFSPPEQELSTYLYRALILDVALLLHLPSAPLSVRLRVLPRGLPHHRTHRVHLRLLPGHLLLHPPVRTLPHLDSPPLLLPPPWKPHERGDILRGHDRRAERSPLVGRFHVLALLFEPVRAASLVEVLSGPAGDSQTL